MWFDLPIQVQDVTFKPLLETRYRFERRLDRDFDGDKADNRNESFLRLRPGFTFETKSGLSGRVVFQFLDNRVSLDNGAAGTSSNPKDLVEAFVTSATPVGKVTLGRQRFGIGNQRLIGALDWANSGRSWDAIRLQRGSVDAFVGRLTVNPVMNQEVTLGAVAYTGQHGNTSLIYKADKRPDPAATNWTLAHQWSKAQGKNQWAAHAALQRGSVSGKRLEAHALGFSVTMPADAQTTLSFEANLASGGSAANATARTFDQLYPTGHLFYGAMDLQGLRNMVQLGASATRKVGADTTIKLELHKFWLADAKDGWYGAGGGQNGAFRDATGKSGKDVGWEADLTGTKALGKDRTLGAGIGVFVPGSFVRSLAVGRDKTQVWGYVMVSSKF